MISLLESVDHIIQNGYTITYSKLLACDELGRIDETKMGLGPHGLDYEMLK